MAEPFTSMRYPLGIDEGMGRLAVEQNYAEHVDDVLYKGA